jgi:pimeloyl-ACP methyl ester carboxylesterase
MARDDPTRLNSLFSFAANSNPSGVLDISTSPVFNDYIARCGVEYAQLSPTPTEYDFFVGNISLMWASQPSITASDFAAMSSNITHPLWIVDGDHEEAINRTDTLFMADSNPQFGLVLLPRVSHFAFIQDPNTFTSHLKNWLRIETPSTGQPTQQTCSPTSSASAMVSSIATLVASVLVAGYLV